MAKQITKAQLQAQNQELRGKLQIASHMNRRIKARYDAAATTESNHLHWANSDFLSPDGSLTHQVRRRLRSRSRYEAGENNSYLKGIVFSLCNDMTGSGPKLVVPDPRYSDSLRQLIEHRFNREYAAAINLREKVWQWRHARTVDGEAFALNFSNSTLDYPIQSDWMWVEADQVTTMDMTVAMKNPGRYNVIDGVAYDRNRIPRYYYLLNRHPGGSAIQYASETMLKKWWGGRWIQAKYILHWYKRTRPALRGVPETVAALPLCAYLRRYTLAVLDAAETAADFTAILKRIAPPSATEWTGTGPYEEDTSYDPFDSFPLDKGMFSTIPDGYDLSQLKAEQPTTVYDKFVDAIVREIARAMCVPFNIASGFSGGYNFASGTLDRQLYHGAINRDRESCETHVLRRIFKEWWFEATRLPDYLGQGLDPDQPPIIKWRWDYLPEHADPSKVSAAAKDWWEMHQLTDDQIQLEMFNRDPAEHKEALKIQTENRDELNLPQPGVNYTAQAIADVDNLDEDMDGAGPGNEEDEEE